jgi:hypothetical protein
MKTSELVQTIKTNDQDYEFYPTTDEIIQCVVSKVASRYNDYVNILDVGCGNGKTLEKLGRYLSNENSGLYSKHVTKLLGIEKSGALRGVCSSDIAIVGCDFLKSNLSNRKLGLVFCNPPFSEFERWVYKLVDECDCQDLVMVLPKRWEQSSMIRDIMQKRGVTAEVLGMFDFLEGERSARAEVDVIRIKGLKRKSSYFSELLKDTIKDEDFINWKTYNSKKSQEKTDLKSKLEDKEGNLLVTGDDYVQILVGLYNDELDKLKKLLEALGNIPTDVFYELAVDFEKLLKVVEDKYSDIDKRYWQEVITRLAPITKRLITKERQELLDYVNELQLDFNAENIYHAVVVCIKAVNINVDKQVLSVYNKLIEDCNVESYKSNKRVFSDDNINTKQPSKLKLSCRVIKGFCGVIEKWNTKNHYCLHHSAGIFIKDLLVISENLGYAITNKKYWQDLTAYICERFGGNDLIGTSEKYYFYANNKGLENILLVEFKFYKNGNVHMKFNQDFLTKMNVIKGKLEGWLYDKKDVMQEFNVKEAEAVQLLGMCEKIVPTQFRLGCTE